MNATIKENPPVRGNVQEDGRGIEIDNPQNIFEYNNSISHNQNNFNIQLLKNLKGNNGQYTSLCPAHDDNNNSLSVKITNDRVLLYCHAGCSTESIVSALGLPMTALFTDEKPKKSQKKKQLINTITYEYRTEDGSLAYRKQRYEYDDKSKSFAFFTPDGKKGRGGKSYPYNLSAVLATKAEIIYFCEGEKCVEAIKKAGRVATSLDAGANSKWQNEYNTYFEDKNVIILPDNDEPGLKYAFSIKKELPNAVIKELPDLPEKGDVFDWLKLGHNIEEIDELPEVEIEPQELEIQIENLPDFIKINPFETSEVRQRYRWDDIGTSNWFADAYKNICRYCPDAKSWYIYDGRVWRLDTGGTIVSKLAKSFTSYMLECRKYLNEEQQENWIQYVANRIKKKNRDTMIADAISVSPIYKKDFDGNDDFFNCQNGTLNLKTFEFKNHDPNDLLTKISNIHYDPKAKSQLFDTFMNEIMQGDVAKTEYLQKALGYSLTADTHYETCFILYGATKRNGKSTLMSTIMYILGEYLGYSLDMKPESLAVKKNHDSRQATGDLARLDGCRFLNVSEPQKRMLLDVTLLKQMTGRDPITARNLYEREFTFYPKFKLFMNTNHLPVVTDDDLFASDRINIITFDRHFKAHEQDKTLKNKLITQENISGIFNWCLQGLQKFRDNGLEPPQTVKNATDEYKNDSDKVGKFIDECLEKSEANPRKNCKAGEVYSIYQNWCELNGYGCENKANFFSELKYKKIFAESGYVNGEQYKNVVRGYIIKTNEIPTPSDKDAPPERNNVKLEEIETDLPFPGF